MVEMTPEEFQAFLKRAAELMREGLRQAVRDTQQDAWTLAREYSSGNLSAAEQRRRDHPYAKRHGGPQANPLIVNVQSGDFRESWELSPIRESDGELFARVFNESRAAPYLAGGTRYMFERPIWEPITRELEPKLEQRAQAAVVRGLKDAAGGG